ncbi:signal peptidase I [Eubacterium sp. 14-2]|uniref:signal peptidase I n=1 Tax=Eubacterium sp. 14-2 TaxID=1235790 RepID=UPI0003B510C6
MNKKEEDRKQEEKRRDKKEGREKSPRDKSDMVKETLSFILYIAIVFLVTYLVIHYVGQRTQVSGTSMEYTLSDGDNLIVDKISYRFHEPERFDIIVFPFRYKEDTYYIKRIIGLPGETVQIDDEGNIYIDGEVLEESYGREIILDPGEAASPIELGDGEYFVLGDNRNASSDSRDPSVGKILREDIIGRAWLRLYPFDRIGFIKHQQEE